MVKISTVIITYNEEVNIARCIDSVQAVADEILVVDSFSTDRTREICREKKVRFIENAFRGHIEQKNFALDQATYNHVLSLDADEALSPELAQSILKAKGHWQADGYTMNRLSSYCGKWIRHCGWYPDRKLRLWNRTQGRWGGHNPHDKVIMQPAATRQHLSGDLLHYTYHTISQHIQQVDFFTGIMAREAVGRGKKAPLLKIICSPVFKFFHSYVIKRGVLDGYYGFIVSAISAHATFIKYVKMREFLKK
jgi:glycosyltransferase involved in cell wall biosynthesis